MTDADRDEVKRMIVSKSEETGCAFLAFLLSVTAVVAATGYSFSQWKADVEKRLGGLETNVQHLAAKGK